MGRSIRLGSSLACALALLAATSCGGGAGSAVGFSNGGNKIIESGGIAELVAEALAEHPGTPPINDEALAEIFGAILDHARDGDPEAALIVFRVAEKQRQEAESEDEES